MLVKHNLINGTLHCYMFWFLMKDNQAIHAKHLKQISSSWRTLLEPTVTTYLNIWLQYGASQIIEQFIVFHDHMLITILIIITAVLNMIITLIWNKHTRWFLLEGQLIKTTCTVVPAVILVFIAIPSLQLLYLIDEILGARGGAFGWGTALQARRPRVQFPMVSLEFFIDTIHLAALCPWGWLSL